MRKKHLFTIIFIIILSIVLLNKIKILDTDTSDQNPMENIVENNSSLDKETFSEDPIISYEEKTANISLLAVGDIMFHMPQLKSAKTQEGSYDFVPVFNHVKKYIQESDISIANFETVTAGREKGYSGFPRFNSPKQSLLALSEVGFDILSTANNHSLDQGREGIISTLKNIEEYGLKSIGTYDKLGSEPLIQEVQGIDLGFLSYTYGVNGLESLLSKDELSYMINLIDEEKIKMDIESLKDKDVDLIVIFIHWGHEYHKEPSEYQISLGNKMVEWGANIILGSHPHVIQKSEIIEYKGKENFIIYSMGNFLSNQRESTMGNPYTEDGVMVKINIEKDFSNNNTLIKDIEYIPTWVHRYTEDNRIKFEILPVLDILGEESEIDLNSDILLRINKSYSDTMEVLNIK